RRGNLSRDLQTAGLRLCWFELMGWYIAQPRGYVGKGSFTRVNSPFPALPRDPAEAI
ncbi:hypothetical protein MNBD_GAMMA10-430, partial [hydrothermal vent metagenome]